MWPFKSPEPEKRASGYTDLITSGLVDRAETLSADALETGALEIAAGYWSRAFAMADGGSPHFNAENLSFIGRSLVRHGEAVLLIRPGSSLLPVVCSDIRGDMPDPAGWMYTVDVLTPDKTMQQDVRGSEVVHVRHGISAYRPWEGRSPVSWARTSAKLGAGLENQLQEETSGNVGYVLPVPGELADPDSDADDPFANLKAQLRDLKGRIAMVESARSSAPTVSQSPMREWEPRRLGASPPASLIELRHQAVATILAMHGITAGMAGVASESATSQREDYRKFLHATVAPIGRIVQDEANMKLGTSFTLSFDQLFAGDVQGRARAFQSMVNGGMDVGRAAALSGLMVQD